MDGSGLSTEGPVGTVGVTPLSWPHLEQRDWRGATPGLSGIGQGLPAGVPAALSAQAKWVRVAAR